MYHLGVFQCVEVEGRRGRTILKIYFKVLSTKEFYLFYNVKLTVGTELTRVTCKMKSLPMLMLGLSLLREETEYLFRWGLIL